MFSVLTRVLHVRSPGKGLSKLWTVSTLNALCSELLVALLRGHCHAISQVARPACLPLRAGSIVTKCGRSSYRPAESSPPRIGIPVRTAQRKRHQHQQEFRTNVHDTPLGRDAQKRADWPAPPERQALCASKACAQAQSTLAKVISTDAGL